MNTKKKTYIPLVALALGSLLALSSCNKFLDQVPDDNRIDINGVADVRRLVATAYPAVSYALVAESSSDNVSEVYENRTNSTQFEDQVYNWRDVLAANNDSPENVWSASWGAINTANVALDALSGLANSPEVRAARAEALLARAYSHFVLVNIFSQAYNPETSSSDLGVPYRTEQVRQLRESSPRLSVDSTYKLIIRDVEAALPDVSDDGYGQTIKYHFNRSAAYAFAARLYLYHRDWQKALDAANQVLSSSSALRNYEAIEELPRSGEAAYRQRMLKFADPTSSNNLLLLSIMSTMAGAPGFSGSTRYSHNTYVSTTETIEARQPWGQLTTKLYRFQLVAPASKVFFMKYPINENWVDRAAGTYYPYTTQSEFTTDETLLVRAESYVHLGQFENALADLQTWYGNFFQNTQPSALTEANILSWNSSTPYSTVTRPTPRKEFNTSIPHADARTEAYLQTVLAARRFETIHTGLRWFDIKRYGIVVERYSVRNQNAPTATNNVLRADDPRRALQIPQGVISAGMQPNPR